MGNFFNKLFDVEKTSKMTINNPRKVFEEVLRQASGSSFTRDVKFNIYYQIIAFYGVVDGVGCSTLVANTALALAKMGLTVCVVDTSILSPVQDVLLNTSEAVVNEDEKGVEHLDWFDIPFTKKSPLHVSKLDKNISVLSFKGKHHGVVDFLSTNDSDSLVEIALATLHNKFDLVLIDCCHELSAVNTACLQQAQQVIQVWNDSPAVVANLENFITNAITLSCPLDKMRFIVANKLSKDVIGNLDSLFTQYRCKLLAKNYLSEELYLLAVTGKPLFQVESKDELVIAYTESILQIVCHILNIDLTGEKPKGTITSNDIMEGKVEGTYSKELKDYNDDLAQKVVIDTNPLGNEGIELDDEIDVTVLPEEVSTAQEEVNTIQEEVDESSFEESSGVDDLLFDESDKSVEASSKKGFRFGKRKDKRKER